MLRVPVDNPLLWQPALTDADIENVLAMKHRRQQEGRRKKKPTAAEEPCLFPELLGKGSEEVLGELRVEILEAERLPKMDGVGTCDPYAVVVFEGCAARTLAVRGKASDRQRPRWGSEAARAFRFPVRCPYSCLYVALKDADDLLGNDGLDPDDDIGRVTLPLSL